MDGYFGSFEVERRGRKVLRGNNKKIMIKTVMVEHGKVKSNCYIIDKKLAYISDISNIKTFIKITSIFIFNFNLFVDPAP